MGGIPFCDATTCPTAGCRPTVCTGAGVPSNATLFDRSRRAIPGGVNSSIRAFKAVGGEPYVVARASGATVDLRRDEPYLAYGELAEEGRLAVTVRHEGDAWSRFAVLLDEVANSLDLVDGCIERLHELPRGPVNVRLPKIVKAPEGATYAWAESPGGINGYYLVSRGEKTPWRLKLRTPGFNNAAALAQVVTGSRVVDLVPVLASMFFVIGDIDK